MQKFQHQKMVCFLASRFLNNEIKSYVPVSTIFKMVPIFWGRHEFYSAVLVGEKFVTSHTSQAMVCWQMFNNWFYRKKNVYNK